MKKLLFTLIFAAFTLSAAHAAEYTIDLSHSHVNFKVKHLAISTVSGRFTDFSGTFQFDPDKMSEASGSVKINVASIDTDIADRDKHLRSADFFDVEKYPEMTFTSSSVTVIDASNFELTGDLTLHGVTKPVTLKVEYGGMIKDPWGKTRVAFTAEGKLKRSDYGLTWNKVMETGGLVVGDEIRIIIEIEAIQNNPEKTGE